MKRSDYYPHFIYEVLIDELSEYDRTLIPYPMEAMLTFQIMNTHFQRKKSIYLLFMHL